MIFIFRKGLGGIVCTLFILSISNAWAGELSFLLSESKIRLSVAPGSSQTGTIKIYSQSDKEINLRAYLEDWEYTDKQDGSKNFFPVQTIPSSAAAWINFSPAEFTLPPWGEKRLNYIVNAPQEATGGYYAVMFFETLLSQPTQLEYIEDEEIRSGVKLAIRIGTLFYIEAEGTIRRLGELTGLSVARDGQAEALSIAVQLYNAGNVDISAGGTFNIIDNQGMVYARGEFNDVATFPGDTAKLTSVWKEPLPKGIYDLILTVDLGKAVAETGTGRVSVIVKETEIEIDVDGQVIKVGELR